MADQGTGSEQDDQASDQVEWQHLDFYVRLTEEGPVLVQTLLRLAPDSEPEVCTFHIAPGDLDEEWASAVWEQSAGLEPGKSIDFVPPDEQHYCDSFDECIDFVPPDEQHYCDSFDECDE